MSTKPSKATLYVNSRMYVEGKTGIKYYIQSLYDSFVKPSFINEIIFVQTKKRPKLGKTQYIRTHNLIGSVLFDLVFVLQSTTRQKGLKILHGPSNILPIIKL